MIVSIYVLVFNFTYLFNKFSLLIEKKTSLRQCLMPSTPSYNNRILCSQAHFSIHLLTSLGLESFRGKYFLPMLLSLIPYNCAPPKQPILTIPRLKLVFDAEWECFFQILCTFLMRKFQDRKGNHFTQFIHDSCTLDNKSKYQVFSLQLMHKTWQCNHVVAILFKKVLSSTGDHVTNLAREQVQRVTGFSFRDICGCSVQDAGTKSAAQYSLHLYLEQNSRKCPWNWNLQHSVPTLLLGWQYDLLLMTAPPWTK